MLCCQSRFPRGSVEEKDLHCCDLGRLLSASLEHDNTGFCPAWLVDKVLCNPIIIDTQCQFFSPVSR